MKKYFYSISLVLFLLVVSESKAQYNYWDGKSAGFDGFTDVSIGALSASSTLNNTIWFTDSTTGAGPWAIKNYYRTTSASGLCAYSGNLADIRMPKVTTTPFYGFLATSVLHFGVNTVSFSAGRASRRTAVFYTTSDTTVTTFSSTGAFPSNWIFVDSTASPSTACTKITLTINNANARRIIFTNTSATGDNDIDSISVTSVNVIAPVKFGNVNASLVNGFVKLNWDILLEVNTQAYYIESSVDGRNFSYVGSLSASNSSKYSYVTSLTNASGNSYYRIKAVDKDGAVTYSNVLRLNTKKTDVEVNINPNPVKDGVINLQLSNFTKATYALNLFDANGKKVFTKSIAIENGLTSQAVEVGNTIAKGIYQLQVTNGNTNVIKTIMIQ